MVRLTCEVKKIARTIDKNIRIISPAATDMDNGVRWLVSFLSKGGGECVDIIGFHFYVNAHDKPESIVRYVRGVRDAMARYDVENKPLWNTETGWYFANAEGGPDIRYRVLTLDESADYLMRALILGASAGLDRFYWYAWNNNKMGGLIEPKSKTLKRLHMHLL